MKILILDDADVRHKYFAKYYKCESIQHVKTLKEFVKHLDLGSPWDLIHLDHDLGDFTDGDTFVDSYGAIKEYNGQHAAQMIIDLSDDMLPKQVIIQSVNPEGARRIKQIIQARGIPVVWHPFVFDNDKNNF